MKEVVARSTARGPYSTIVRAGDFVFLSGQGGIDPDGRAVTPDGFAAEAQRTFANIADLLTEAGLGLADLVSLTCYLVDMDDWQVLNSVTAEVLPPDALPVRTTVAVRELPFGLTLEITAVAFDSSSRT